jgi:hypothetical protein
MPAMVREAPVEPPGRCHIDATVATLPGGNRKPSQRPATRPPTCAAMSMGIPPPVITTPSTRLMTMRPPICPSTARLRRSRTGSWTRCMANRIPKSPNTAPDAPTEGAGPPNARLAADPAAAVST